MPAEIDDTQQEAIALQLVNAGVPESLHPAIFAAIDTAGYTVVDKTNGTPATLLAGSTVETYTLDQRSGWRVVGVKLATGKYLTWIEYPEDGRLARTAPVFVDVGSATTMVS